MDTLLCLVAGALALGQPAARADWSLAPELQSGLELTYVGSYLDEPLVPNVQFQRQFRLETHVLVLDVRPGQTDLAIMTALGLQDPSTKDRARPTSVRLDLARLDARGRLLGLDGKALSIATTGPPTLELGFLVDVPVGKVKRNDVWEVAPPGSTPLTWQLVGTESCGGLTCLKITGQQESLDWSAPRADQVAWRRRDTIWLAPQLNVAQKVERVVERRDPARQQPTHRATVRYELASKLRYPGKLFDERKREIAKVRQWQDEARAWLRSPTDHQSQIEMLLKRVAQYVDGQPPTPYRPALLHFKTALETARSGVVPVEASNEETPAPIRAVEIGQRVPDFVVSSLTERESARLSRLLGRPILVVFYNPSTPTGREVLLFVKGLADKQRDQLAVLALAVTNDPDAARQQHADLRLPFAVLDGQGVRPMFGVDATPRLLLLDAQGVVRCAQTGWGVQTGQEIVETLKRCQSR